MRSGALIFLFCCQCLVGPAFAGAWLKEEGKGFLSTSFSANYFRDIASEIYAEYGMRSNLTIGIDVGLYTLRDGSDRGYATAFVRRPLGGSDGPHRFSYELGIGAGWTREEVTPLLKTGLSWGRGLQVKDKFGWVNVDTSVTWDLGPGQHVPKIDTTVGLNFTEQTTGMLQLYLVHLDSEIYSSLAPSLVLKPEWAKFRIQIGALAPLKNLDDAAIKIGIWREF